eukprot:gene3230-3538_t
MSSHSSVKETKNTSFYPISRPPPCSEEVKQIYHMMVLSDKLALPHSMMIALINDENITERGKLIRWLYRQNPLRNCCVHRDTTLRIFDTYIATVYQEQSDILQNPTRLAFTAAASLILSSKLLCANSPLTAACLQNFITEELENFEREVVIKTTGLFSPQCTPSAFLPFILDQCKSIENRDALQELAISVIGEFLEDSLSLLFAPSTIAISAVIVSLSLLHKPVDTLLANLPQFMLTSANQPFFQDEKAPYLDLQLCNKFISRLCLRAHSPSAVWNMSEGEQS